MATSKRGLASTRTLSLRRTCTSTSSQGVLGRKSWISARLWRSSECWGRECKCGLQASAARTWEGCGVDMRRLVAYST